jgi:hypothetical protein
VRVCWGGGGAGVQGCGYSGVRVCGSAGARVCGCAGVRECESAGVQVYGCTGARVCGCAGVRMCGFSVPVCGCAGARMRGCGGAQAPCRVHKYHVGSWYLVSSPPPQYQRASSVSWQLWALLGSTHVAIINLAMSTFLLTAQPSCDNSGDRIGQTKHRGKQNTEHRT